MSMVENMGISEAATYVCPTNLAVIVMIPEATFSTTVAVEELNLYME